MTKTKRMVAGAVAGVALALSPLIAIPASANGNGNATGKPCDGCVGQADDKSPGGQATDDPNAGYECDSNHGIGRANPAHTGCEQ